MPRIDQTPRDERFCADWAGRRRPVDHSVMPQRDEAPAVVRTRQRRGKIPVLRRCRMVSVAYRGMPTGGCAVVLWKSSIDRGDPRGMLGIRRPTRVLVRCPCKQDETVATEIRRPFYAYYVATYAPHAAPPLPLRRHCPSPLRRTPSFPVSMR